ncbi:MAG: glycerophosphodiester phosphodiesterase [Elusimicrobia bacterium]|nr:glycerophosphodiester phosphodiesterase [Candidatus Liberimonas magnetica]
MLLKIGHRGACGYEPENTLLSFKKALALGADMVELDVHLCKSGELVVIHDDSVDRTTNGKGKVILKNLSELKTYDAGKSEKIPSLTEVIELINRKAKINIELKEKNSVEKTLAVVKEYVTIKGWSYNDFLFSSFDLNILYSLRELSGEKARVALLIDKIVPDIPKIAVDLDLFSINIEKCIATQGFVNEMHLISLKVMVWTVNDVNEMKLYTDYGIDGIFSDFPDRIHS